MKKKDYILIAAIIIIAVVLLLLFGKKLSGDAGMVEVTVDGKVTGTYRLDKEQEIRINGTNLLVIKDGEADMTDADCPDKICVNQKPVSKKGESLVCLPNKVIVTVIEGDTNEVDTVAN